MRARGLFLMVVLLGLSLFGAMTLANRNVDGEDVLAKVAEQSFPVKLMPDLVQRPKPVAVLPEIPAEPAVVAVEQPAPAVEEPPAVVLAAAAPPAVTPKPAPAAALPIKTIVAPPSASSQTTVGAPVAVAAEAAVSAPAPRVAVIRATRVNVRSGPSTSNSVVTKAVQGQEVEMLGEEPNGWVEVLVDGSFGYIRGDLLEETPRG